MEPDFESALDDLLNKYKPITDVDALIMGLELAAIALRDDARDPTAPEYSEIPK